MICRFQRIPRTSKEILSKTGFDTAQFQQVDFVDKVELSRNANLEIDDSGSAVKPTGHGGIPGSLPNEFERRLTQIVTSRGKKIGPDAQMLIGPVTKSNEYLKASNENALLFTTFTPSFLLIPSNSSTPRRDRYHFKSYEQLIHFEVYVDGYFHARFPIPVENNENTVWLGNMIFRLSSLLFYAVRIMKLRKVVAQQRIHLELTGFQNVEVLPSRSPLRLGRYYFPSDREKIIFESNFDPSVDWKIIFGVACSIYHEILIELGITDMSDTAMRDALKALVQDDGDLRTSHTLPKETVPIVDLNAMFG